MLLLLWICFTFSSFSYVRIARCSPSPLRSRRKEGQKCPHRRRAMESHSPGRLVARSNSLLLWPTPEHGHLTWHALIGCYMPTLEDGHWHARIGCFGPHRRPSLSSCPSSGPAAQFACGGGPSCVTGRSLPGRHRRAGPGVASWCEPCHLSANFD